MVPTIEANTPPLSISATNITGELETLAISIFAISVSLKFISAQLPDPSKTIKS